MTLDIKLAIERFRSNGGRIEEDSNGELSFSFLRAGDPIPNRYWKYYPPLSPREEKVYTPFAVDGLKKVKQEDMERLAAFLEGRSEETKEVLEKDEMVYVKYNELYLSDAIALDDSIPEDEAQFLEFARRSKKRVELSELRLDFMRRDPQFVAAYDQIKLIRKKAGPYIHQMTKEYYETTEGQIETELCKQFELFPPFPAPDLDLGIDAWMNKWRPRRIGLVGEFLTMDSPTKPFSARYRKGQPHLLTLKIDFSQCKTQRQFLMEISDFLKTYMAQNGLVENRNYSKNLEPSPEKLEAILTAGRLKESPGATYDSVMAEMSDLPGTPIRGGKKEYDSENNYEYNKSIVKGLLDAYRDLTEKEGWRKIGIYR